MIALVYLMLGRMLGRALRWFPETWSAIDRQAAAERARWPRGALPFERSEGRPGGPRGKYDSSVAQILVLAAVVLTFEWYWGDRPYFQEDLAKGLSHHPFWGRYFDLLGFSWWSGAKLVGFLLVPAIHIWLMGGRVRDHGLGLSLRARGQAEGAGPDGPGRRAPGGWIYVVLFGLVLPLVAVASFTRSFQHTYPFYRLTGRSWLDFLGWELQYGVTFISVEFFFRGYLLFGLRRALGSHAIFVMVVPYCMIHVLKPPAECLGAIGAGVVLGTLALGTGSIWYGVLIHVSVAWSMDLLAAIQTHGFPPWGRWLP